MFRMVRSGTGAFAALRQTAIILRRPIGSPAKQERFRHYDGPQPPKGHGANRYHFKLAALGVENLDVPPGVKTAELWQRAATHIVAQAEPAGTFEAH